MSIVYSPSAHVNGTNSGFYFSDDPNAPEDSFLVSGSDHMAAINAPQGSTYSFAAPTVAGQNGVLTITAPTDAYVLAQAQAAQVSALKAAYQAAISAPVTFKNAAGVTSTYSAGNIVAINGQTAKQNLEDAINGGAAGWSMGFWLDTHDVAQTFTYADLQGLSAAMANVTQADFKELATKIAQVQAATTVAAVQAVTWS